MKKENLYLANTIPEETILADRVASGNLRRKIIKDAILGYNQLTEPIKIGKKEGDPRVTRQEYIKNMNA